MSRVLSDFVTFCCQIFVHLQEKVSPNYEQHPSHPTEEFRINEFVFYLFYHLYKHRSFHKGVNYNDIHCDGIKVPDS